MTSSQGTQPSKMNKTEATLEFIEAFRSLPEIWYTENRCYTNRVKKAAAYDSIIEKLKMLEPDASRTRRHAELTKKKLKNPMGNLCCAREHSVQFFVQFVYTVKLHSLT
jgi:hypothetical protein